MSSSEWAVYDPAVALGPCSHFGPCIGNYFSLCAICISLGIISAHCWFFFHMQIWEQPGSCILLYPIRKAYGGVTPPFSPKPFLLCAQQTHLSASPMSCAPVPKPFWWLSIAHAPVRLCLSCTRKPQTGCAPWDIVTEVTDREWTLLELLAILLLIHPIIWLASTALY